MISLLTVLFGIGTLLAWCYYGACVISAYRLKLRPKRAAKNHTPPVSILIPLRGDDPEQLTNFRSFCQLHYPCYQVVFGVLDAQDTALVAARQVVVEFPDCDITVVAGGDIYGNNRKVSNLINMIEHARHEMIVLCDSDMRVQPDYLRDVMAPFTDPEVGLVTCLYRGTNALNATSAMEVLGIGTTFLPGVLLAEQISGMRFGLGATISLSKTMLASIGGLYSLADELADDYRLGEKVYHSGKRVALADCVVDTVMGRETFSAMWSRRLRWARTVRAMQSVGWTANVVTYGLPHSIGLLLTLGGRTLGWQILAVTLLIRWLSAFTIAAYCIKDRETLRYLPLLPISDLLEFLLWVASFCGRTVSWRGEKFLLLRDGRLQRIEEPHHAPEAV